MTVTAPSADAFIGKIERNLPDKSEPRSRIILLRALLLLLRVRTLPNFMPFSIKLLATMEESIVWRHRARFELGNIVAIFSKLDDPTVAGIREGLQKLLDETVPEDSLKAHFAKTFGATCIDTDHVAKVGDNPAAIMLMFAVALESSVDALEDFTVEVDADIEDSQIRATINAFYERQGFRVVDGDDDIIYAQTGILGLWIKFSNHSSSDGIIMVTVKEE